MYSIIYYDNIRSCEKPWNKLWNEVRNEMGHFRALRIDRFLSMGNLDVQICASLSKFCVEKYISVSSVHWQIMEKLLQIKKYIRAGRGILVIINLTSYIYKLYHRKIESQNETFDWKFSVSDSIIQQKMCRNQLN